MLEHVGGIAVAPAAAHGVILAFHGR